MTICKSRFQTWEPEEIEAMRQLAPFGHREILKMLPHRSVEACRKQCIRSDIEVVGGWPVTTRKGFIATQDIQVPGGRIASVWDLPAALGCGT